MYIYRQSRFVHVFVLLNKRAAFSAARAIIKSSWLKAVQRAAQFEFSFALIARDNVKRCGIFFVSFACVYMYNFKWVCSYRLPTLVLLVWCCSATITNRNCSKRRRRCERLKTITISQQMIPSTKVTII